MASQEEWSAMMRSDHQHQVEGGNYGSTASSSSSKKARPPHAPKKTGELAPLIPRIPQSAPLNQSQPPPPSSSRRKLHGRSRSDHFFAPPPTLDPAPQSDPSHPFNKPAAGSSRPSSSRPPRSTVSGPLVPPSPSNQFTSAGFEGFSTQSKHANRKSNVHRRAKSDIPLNLFSGGGGSASGRLITKADLLKNFPDPRWGGVKKHLQHVRSRSRTGSDGPLLSDGASIGSGGTPGGYGSTNGGAHTPVSHPLLTSVGSVELKTDAKCSSRHSRAISDMSVRSVTTNMAKSALLKEVTDTGRIRLQLPKDSFRILMDSQLEAGHVYKRKLVDSEDQFFVEFHTEEEGPGNPDHACQCLCDRCNRCQERQKALPPDLYVMAVDATIYRRMLDEVIQSRAMPCGTFFCGHHEDVRHPDITIAALIVGGMFFILLAGSIIIWD